MKVASFEAIVRALNDAKVPFIVVGGIAVNTHGYGRVTFDVDLVINLKPAQIAALFPLSRPLATRLLFLSRQNSLPIPSADKIGSLTNK